VTKGDKSLPTRRMTKGKWPTPLGMDVLSGHLHKLSRAGNWFAQYVVWAWMDSNHRPADYESAALTF
jgi:hypothetical protein